MLVTKKTLNNELTELTQGFDTILTELHNRLDLAERVILKIMENQEVNKNNLKILEDRTKDNTAVLDILIEGDKDRLKALNLTMELVEEANGNTYTLVDILRKKGLIDTEDFKGD